MGAGGNDDRALREELASLRERAERAERVVQGQLTTIVELRQERDRLRAALQTGVTYVEQAAPWHAGDRAPATHRLSPGAVLLEMRGALRETDAPR